MIKLFPKNTTNFETNGIKILQPISCSVTEELNGDFSLTITMPKWDNTIQNEMIIKAPTPVGEQLFRVYCPNIDAFGNNVYFARHIFYDLLDYFIEDSRPNGNGQAAIISILANTPFTGTSNITVNNTAYYQMMSPVTAIFGDDTGFVNRWGGEIKRDNFNVNMLSSLGSDRGVTIRYRKNLTGLTVKTDLSNVVTRIYPTGRQEDGQTLLKLPESYVDSLYINNYIHPKVERIDYSEVKTLDELRSLAKNEYALGRDKPVVTADVKFIPLETTEEYKDFKTLESVYIGDTVHVYHEPLNMELKLRVSKYEYDSVNKRYTSVTLGTVSPSFGARNSILTQSISSATTQVANEAKNNLAAYDAEVRRMNDLLMNAMGFYSTVEKQLDGSIIYYMHNQPNLRESSIIWKVSVDGFGVSTDGGVTYHAGLTADGNAVLNVLSAKGINANWLNAGKIDATIVNVINLIANNITAGKLQSKNGKVYFDLDNDNAAVTKLISPDDISTYAIIGKNPHDEDGRGLFLTATDSNIFSFYQNVKENTYASVLKSYDELFRIYLQDDYKLIFDYFGGCLYTHTIPCIGWTVDVPLVNPLVQLFANTECYRNLLVDGNFDVSGNSYVQNLHAKDLYTNGVKVTSDRDKKCNIEPVEISALDKIKDMNFYSYNLKENDPTVRMATITGFEGTEQLPENQGVDVSKLDVPTPPQVAGTKVNIGIMYDEAPAEIKSNDDNNKTIDLYSQSCLNAKAIQELLEEVKDLKARVVKLESNNKISA